jgi:hypothetical protein
MISQGKGQITIEFILSTLFFIIMLTAIIFLVVDYVPDIEDVNRRAQVNMEARRVSTMLLTTNGRNTTGSTNWEDTPNSLTSVGLASDYHVVDMGKLDAISTRSASKLNYSQFRELADVESNYRMRFTSLPIIDTSESFRRDEPPEDPNITEPVNTDYFNAGNNVNYGTLLMGNSQYNFLVTSHDGQYDTIYRAEDSSSGWNFTGAPRYGTGDRVTLGGKDFNIQSIQNRGEKGTMVFLSRHIKTFGSSLVVDATIVKINRYAALEQEGANLQPMRMEVFAWRSS